MWLIDGVSKKPNASIFKVEEPDDYCLLGYHVLGR
jgi:hypothetical protein